MKKLLFLFFTLPTIAFAQNSSKDINKLNQQVQQQMKKLDSLAVKRDAFIKRQQDILDSNNRTYYNEQNNRNISRFVKEVQEKKKKKKQQMWLRLGIGILLLAVGIAAMRRRKKAKENNTTS